MHIIPVIDLLNGICVHAKKGERSYYQPVISSLTNSSQPLDIVKAFMDIYPFKTLYIADLNAIQSTENSGTSHIKVLEKVKQHFPQLKLWVDAGVNSIAKAKPLVALDAQMVLGSESFQTITQYDKLSKQMPEPFTLSLDFAATGFTGPNHLLEQTKYWPTDVIVMTLAKVGSNMGVEINTIKHIIQRTTQQHLYAAGGVRHLDDLLRLHTLQVKGALIASALHNKSISSQALENLTPSNQ